MAPSAIHSFGLRAVACATADAAAGATGSIWVDDIRLNDNALLVADQAMGEVAVTARIAGRWTP